MTAYKGSRLRAAALLMCAILTSTNTVWAAGKPQAFLQQQLPLSIIITTPVELANPGNGSVSMFGRQAITVVFSRPVIALGSDFGTPAEQQKLPFQLSCRMPGKTRWVTTTIARFDPDADWPSDLACDLRWNTSLETYDGVPLQLGPTPPSVRLTSHPLQMFLTDVDSPTARNLTGGLWSPFAAGAGQLPEVPPDGKIVLSFSQPVDPRMLQSALQFALLGHPPSPPSSHRLHLVPSTSTSTCTFILPPLAPPTLLPLSPF
ncbi:hypothetical protein Agub_g14427 [Astrephomene gubernaculifera]|uniref:Uncharacterized protein n=1 Tax=Astrephomene gubernaculifera TaxID=47775 RepID=A0AAD3E1Q3_9CHLO|nr:hypothetical protein Agub_g14427 [Astrephomene gubernaculifera]